MPGAAEKRPRAGRGAPGMTSGRASRVTPAEVANGSRLALRLAGTTAEGEAGSAASRVVARHCCSTSLLGNLVREGVGWRGASGAVVE